MYDIAVIDAAVLGLLGAALYDPVCSSAIRGPFDLAIVLIGFFTLLASCRRPLPGVPVRRVAAGMSTIFPKGISVLFGNRIIL